MQHPSWLKPVGVTVAALVTALLIAGIVAVVYRSLRSPEGYDQPRLTWNTKNTTRFGGADTSAIAAQVSQAVYPATEPANTPDVVIVYAPDDWQGGLAAASLLRPLNAVLLPATGAIAAEIERLKPKGSAALGGTQVLRLNDARPPPGTFKIQTVTGNQIADLLNQAGTPPRHVLVVDPNEPGTALLAGPWASTAAT